MLAPRTLLLAGLLAILTPAIAGADSLKLGKPGSGRSIRDRRSAIFAAASGSGRSNGIVPPMSSRTTVRAARGQPITGRALPGRRS